VGKPIFIQQDNAPSHLKLDDPLFCEADKLNWVFFRAIQAIQYKKNTKNNISSSSSRARGNLIKLFTRVSFFLQ